MRLFVSIDFLESTREKIHSWIPELKGWKKTSLQQLHLTLVFLGDCSFEEKQEIHEKLIEIEFTPFEVVIEGLGVFPNKSAPRVLWAAVRQNDMLLKLQEIISDRLKGHIKSKRIDSYIPHITLARKKSGKSNTYIMQKILQKETGYLVENVVSFQLKQSILKSSGTEYQTLHTYS
jgi:2'-5' RNA ligase